MTLPDPTITYVLARVGGVPIAVAAAAVRAALPIPQQWHRLPRRQGAIVGVLPTAQGPQALVELSAWVELSAPPSATGVALVLQDAQGRSLAVRVDALEGLHRAFRDGVRPLYRDDRDDELFAAVLVNLGQSDAEREPRVDGVCVLEVERLMRLAQCWAEGLDLASAAAAARVDTARGVGAALHAVVRLAATDAGGSALLAVPAREVAEVLPCPAFTHRWAPGGMTAGIASWRGRAVAVLRPAGLGLPAADTPPLALMLEDTEGRGLLLPVSEMLGLHLLPADATEPGDGWLTPAQDSLHGPIRTLRTPTLLRSLPEAILNPGEAVGPGARAQAGPRNPEPFLVFDAGHRFALPISQVHAVLARPPGVDVIDWRDERLQLAPVPGLPALAPGDGGCVIVVGAPGRLVAWRIKRPHAFVPSRSAELRDWRGQRGPGTQLLCVDEPAATYPVLQAS